MPRGADCTLLIPILKLDVGGVLDGGVFGVIDFEELFVSGKAKHLREYAGGEDLALGIEVAHDAVVEAAAGLDLVLVSVRSAWSCWKFWLA